jgi:peptidoglycan L-alanyl-D-glutamate endopeptidase CwlK
MPQFSQKSFDKLNTCDTRLIKLFKEVVKHFDCSIISGHRGEDEQNGLFEDGKSKLQYPNSNHNSFPSKAVDAAPYIAGKGVVWEKQQLYAFAFFVKGVASQMGYKIRLGADWDGDNDIHDQAFFDRPHFEILD